MVYKCMFSVYFQERIFQCWFNTFFVQAEALRTSNVADGQKLKYLTLEMRKTELDKANKDKNNSIYRTDFKVSHLIPASEKLSNIHRTSI